MTNKSFVRYATFGGIKWPSRAGKSEISVYSRKTELTSCPSTHENRAVDAAGIPREAY